MMHSARSVENSITFVNPSLIVISGQLDKLLAVIDLTLILISSPNIYSSTTPSFESAKHTALFLFAKYNNSINLAVSVRSKLCQVCSTRLCFIQAGSSLARVVKGSKWLSERLSKRLIERVWDRWD